MSRTRRARALWLLALCGLLVSWARAAPVLVQEGDAFRELTPELRVWRDVGARAMLADAQAAAAAGTFRLLRGRDRIPGYS
ncbi:MAG: hypothetical protein ACK4UT_02180, partial [Moraxellaceae bacterium]